MSKFNAGDKVKLVPGVAHNDSMIMIMPNRTFTVRGPNWTGNGVDIVQDTASNIPMHLRLYCGVSEDRLQKV